MILGVSAVVHATLYQMAGEARWSIQVIDAETGAIAWAESGHGQLDDKVAETLRPLVAQTTEVSLPYEIRTPSTVRLFVYGNVRQAHRTAWVGNDPEVEGDITNLSGRDYTMAFFSATLVDCACQGSATISVSDLRSGETRHFTQIAHLGDWQQTRDCRVELKFVSGE